MTFWPKDWLLPTSPIPGSPEKDTVEKDTVTSPSSAIDVVTAVVPPGSHILDIGCGSGEFAAALVASGYRVTGVEPQERRIAEARTRAPGADFQTAGAEALPFHDMRFDAATMIHSLHHVPHGLMHHALVEALRCIGSGGSLIVVEPPPEGSFHDVFKLIDDETLIRNQAQAALGAACEQSILRRVASWRWETSEVYADVDALIEDVAAVDAERRAKAAAFRKQVGNALRTHGKHGPEGYALVHPVRADVFRR